MTPEQIKSLNDYQNSQRLHPLTCGNDRHDAPHVAYQAKYGGDHGQLVAMADGWHCPACDYVQPFRGALEASLLDLMTHEDPLAGFWNDLKSALDKQTAELEKSSDKT